MPKRTITLPKRFPYLSHKNKEYTVSGTLGDTIRVLRDDGVTEVEISVHVIQAQLNALKAAPGRTLKLQSLPECGFGQSIIGAILVAAGLAKVTKKRPVTLTAT